MYVCVGKNRMMLLIKTTSTTNSISTATATTVSAPWVSFLVHPSKLKQKRKQKQ